MGHQRLGILPMTRNWQAVIKLIAGGADVGTVAYRTARAAERALGDRSNEPAVRKTFFLLARVPLAARTGEFAPALRKLGIPVGDEPTLAEITAAFLAAVDRHVGAARSDFGEMVALSAAESLHAVAGRALEDLFGWQGTSPGKTRETLAELSTVKQFGLLSKDFFCRLLRNHLDYYLSRELPSHVGLSKRFASLRELSDFEDALDAHARETAEIVRRFAGEWHAKYSFETGISEKDAGAFVAIAFKKLTAELRVRDPVHA